jgi:hypothetical protein
LNFIGSQKLDISRKNQCHFNLEIKKELKSLAVLAGISSQGILGHFFFADFVTGPLFLKIMKDNILPQIRETFGHDCRIQMDGAPSHWARSVREWIDEEFLDRWIGRDGPVPWRLSPLTLRHQIIFFENI